MNPIFKNKTTLEIIEGYAFEAAAISSEIELSELFDKDVKNSATNMDNKPALMQEFRIWKDQMHRDGYIHTLQAHNYCYVGELF